MALKKPVPVSSSLIKGLIYAIPLGILSWLVIIYAILGIWWLFHH